MQYRDFLMSTGPALHLKGSFDGRFGVSWRNVSDWSSEGIMHANGVPVSREQLTKFIRNKLGAGHFDEEDRKRWQRDLLEVTEGLQNWAPMLLRSR